MVLETRKDGTVNVTKAYSNIIDNIKEAEEASNMADGAANDTLEVQEHCLLLSVSQSVLLSQLQPS